MVINLEHPFNCYFRHEFHIPGTVNFYTNNKVFFLNFLYCNSIQSAK